MNSPLLQNSPRAFLHMRRLPLSIIPLLLLIAGLAGCGSNFNVLAHAQVVVSQSSITWGQVAVGQAGGPKTATLTNSGTASIDIKSIGFTGTNPGDFAIYRQGCGSTLAASASCTVTILFKPTASGTRTANLTFTDSAPTSPQQVSLSGVGISGDSTGGTATVSPTSISWSKVNVGQAGGPKVATLTNTGSASISISSIGFTGTNAGDFAIYQKTCGSTLAASASCTVTVLFKPTTSGTRTATLTFTDSAGNSPQEVALSGLGVSSSGSVTVSPASLSFGSVSVGGSSASQTITLTNGTSASVALSGAGISGTNAADFAVSSTTCGSSLGASASCTANVLFKPTASGALAATWSVNDGSSSLSVALSGSGVASAGTATVSPTSISWSKVNVGQAGGPKVATLTNTGGTSISISNIGFTGTNPGDFAIYQQTCGSTLAASASCTVTILFKPTTSGTRTANLAFADGASNSPQQVALSGLGEGGSSGSVTANPTSLNFGSVSTGSSSAPQTITITNSTASSVTLSAAAISGANAGDFAISSTTCGSTLAASASCTTSITFTPTATGTRAATWSVNDGSGTLSVALSGSGTGPSGSVTATPTSLNFGSVSTGSSSAPQTITITNSTSSSVTLSAAAISGTNAGDFAISSTTCGSTLAASASCTTSITFTPTATGARAATWSLNDGSGTLSVALSGSGTGPSGSITATPTSLNFGSVSTGSSSAAQAIIVTNSTASSVTLSAAAISGTNAGDFAISSTTCGSTLAASASCTTSITFTPTATGARAATWSLNDGSGTVSVALSGSGANSSGVTFTASPTSIVWGTVAFGQTSGSKTATLTNNGTAAVTVNGITLAGADAGDFSVSSNTCGSSLPASSSCTATLYFAPKGTGTRTATLSFNDAAGNSPQNISLSGTGGASTTGSVTASPTKITFPQTTIGETSSATTATLMNGTASAVNITGITFQGAQPGDFTQVSTTCGTSLASNASCTVDIAFKPTAGGTRTAALSFADSASNSPQSVALSGVGVSSTATNATASPSSISFGSYVVGTTSAARQVTLTNNGSATISYSGATITGANAGDFYITSKSCGTNLGASQSCYIQVIFSPTATGARAATLSITDSAANSPQTVALSGTGTSAATATLTISPSSLSWGSQNVGVAASAKTFTLTAGGSGSVSFSSIGFTGTDPGDFAITASTCGTGIAQDSSCTVSVTFTPAAIGNRVALFSVVDNAIASPQTAEVSGSGANSTAQTPGITVDFGSRSGSQVAIPANMLGTEYLESLPTDANRATVVQGGFTTARYRLDMTRVYTNSDTPSWGGIDYDMAKYVTAGVHPLIELVNTPAFLQPSPSPCPSDPATSVPTDVNEWGKLAASFVAHFDQKFPGFVTEYEIWNEPDTAALCSTSSTNRESDYIRIYAAAAPQMEQQAKADGVSIVIGGPANAGPAWLDLLHNSSTAPYMDFYSYHFYEGNSTDTKDGMTWDGAGGTPSLRAMILDPSHGVQALYLQAYGGVKSATTPAGAKTPIYFDEYNDDWAFVNDCCRNSPTYSPLFNSMTVAQLLNSVYKGAGEVPAKLIYYSAAQKTFCILGIIDSQMDCAKAATGDQAQPYPQWYTYRMIFNPSYLDLQDGGHMAASVTLSSSASSDGIIATGWYTGTEDSILVINPTATSYSGVTLQINNSGLSSPTSTLYTINAQNPQVSQWPATTISASGGLQSTFDLPAYSVVAVSLK